ncbi:MAG: NADPH:quinone oxidoreductase family protein [Polyangiales bacterium]
MYRMIVRELGGPASLQREEMSSLSAGPGEVVIDVKAIGCNFFDILITRGKYQIRPDLPFSPGAEVAGTVRELGEGVRDLSIGDRVSALLEYGGFASAVAVPRERVFPMPMQMTFEEAAALGLVYQTSYVALVHRAQLLEGETLLVHAAAGGVGLAAVQIGVALGARVIGTAGSPEKLDLVRRNGADAVINYRTEDFVERVKELTAGRGADVIYDPVGGDTFDKSMKCIAFEGRLLVIGFASGTIPLAQMNRVLLKNISLVGLHWGLYFKEDPGLLEQTQDAIFRLHAEGKISPLVSSTYPLDRASAALVALGARETTGKIVLIP